MAIKVSYQNNTEYSPTEDVALNKSIVGNKIIVGESSLLVTANTTANMGVKVSAGKAWINGYFINSTASVSLSVTGNTSGYSRIDSVVVEASASVGEIKIIEGTPGSNPTEPILNSNQIRVANITVVNNAISIIESNIKDCRETIIVASLADMVIEAYERPYVIKSSYNTNPSYRLWSDGYKEIWGAGLFQHHSGGNYDELFKWDSTGIEFKDYNSMSVDFRFQNQSNTTWLSGSNYVNIRVDNGSEFRVVILNLEPMFGLFQWKVSGY